jgi:hypothetical protein
VSVVEHAAVQMLLGSVVDSWDKLREVASQSLLALPAPLPGLGLPADVCGLVEWARKLVSSPRVRESDAGEHAPALSLSRCPACDDCCRMAVAGLVINEDLVCMMAM